MRLTASIKDKIRYLFGKGYSYNQIANMLGISEFDVVRTLRPRD